MYSEVRIPELSATLWRVTPEDPCGDVPTESLIVPDGCMDLIVLGAEVVVAGADSTARVVRSSSLTSVGLRFDPGVLPQLLATSAAELANALTPLDAVLPDRPFPAGGDDDRWATAKPLRGAVGRPGTEAMDPGARLLLGIAGTLADRTELDPRPMAFAAQLRPRRHLPAAEAPPGAFVELPPGAITVAAAGETAVGAISIAEVAERFAYSPRQLRRLSAEWFGYGPKHLAKILRWQAARQLIAAGRTKTAAAAAVGYSDASHLWRDEKDLLDGCGRSVGE